MSDWIMLLPSVVFSRIKGEFSEEIKTSYGMTGSNFSTTDSSNKKAVFPFVYVHLLPAVEEAQTLDEASVNGGLFTFQIDVYDNQSQNRARKVMGEIVRILKSMRFNIIAMPELESGDTHRCIARFRRTIGSGDVL